MFNSNHTLNYSLFNDKKTLNFHVLDLVHEYSLGYRVAHHGYLLTSCLGQIYLNLV